MPTTPRLNSPRKPPYLYMKKVCGKGGVSWGFWGEFSFTFWGDWEWVRVDLWVILVYVFWIVRCVI